MAQLCLFADPVSEWRANTSGQYSEQRTRTEPWRPQRRDSSRDPQWDQRRHGCQERSDFEGLRPVARQIYEIINLTCSLEQSSKDGTQQWISDCLSLPHKSERTEMEKMAQHLGQLNPVHYHLLVLCLDQTPNSVYVT